jgi:hypothetical protein
MLTAPALALPGAGICPYREGYGRWIDGGINDLLTEIFTFLRMLI